MAAVNSTSRTPAAERTIRRALKIIEAEVRAPGPALCSPRSVSDYLKLKIGVLDREVFWAVWMDAQNRVIEFEELFRGTLTQTSVYPREVVRSAMRCNAAGAIFAHNHPSGVCEPSRSDELLTQALKQALTLVDVKVLDHFIISGGAAMSFAERGIL